MNRRKIRRLLERRNGGLPPLALNEHEAAERLGLSVGFLRKDRLGARLIPYVKLNKAVRYRCVDLEEALARHLMGAKRKG